MPEKSTVTHTTLTPTITKFTEKLELSERHVAKRTTPQRCYVEANAKNRPVAWKSKHQQQDAQDSITGCVRARAQPPNIYLKMSLPL